MTDPHKLLGISKNASVSEIRRAHRELARRWHPDRFQEGPERMWAECKMVEINIAFEAALSQAVRVEGVLDTVSESEQLEDVRKLLDLAQFAAARQALMRIPTRSAEWNYLFATVLTRLGELEKAALYFGIASRQRPDNAQYHAAYKSAVAARLRNRIRPRLNWLLGKK